MGCFFLLFATFFVVFLTCNRSRRSWGFDFWIESSLAEASTNRVSMSIVECIFENMIGVYKYISGFVDLMKAESDPADEF